LAQAIHDWSFVWSDGSKASGFQSSATNQFSVLASGGVRFFTNNLLTTGCSIAPGGGSWSCTSDRNSKENFVSASGNKVLEKLDGIPFETWNYKSQDPSIRHMGPMAQDFYAAFGLGEDDKHIDTVDADGVALAAIQALYRQTQEQQQEIRRLEEQSQKDDAIREENRALTLRLERLEELVEKRFGDQLSEAILK
jgi:hypothetical protein